MHLNTCRWLDLWPLRCTLCWTMGKNIVLWQFMETVEGVTGSMLPTGNLINYHSSDR